MEVEKGAGAAADFTDQAYENAGATMVGAPAEPFPPPHLWPGWALFYFCRLQPYGLALPVPYLLTSPFTPFGV